jgi:hypothetical protein
MKRAAERYVCVSGTEVATTLGAVEGDYPRDSYQEQYKHFHDGLIDEESRLDCGEQQAAGWLGKEVEKHPHGLKVEEGRQF